ncbi:MAG: DUF1552 domain-containing protein [Marinagarivorans sp.]|nr:DUF1552 domain-containing protein [Marinagarivorans sp.]
MKKTPLKRRTFLRGIAYGAPTAVALPILDCMLNENGTALAQEGAIPRRLGVFYWGSGVHTNRFFPTTTGANWELTPQLQPFAGVREHINVLRGYDIKSNGIVHHVGTCVMKTGANYIKNAAQFDTDVAKESFDVTAGRTLAKGRPFEHLAIGLYVDGRNAEGLNTRALSHRGRNQPNFAEINPQTLFDRLFGVSRINPVNGAGVGILARQSVLDSVLGDIQALMPRLGAADKMKAEQHLEAIRSIEERLVPPEGAACQHPARPSVGSPNVSNPNINLHHGLMVDLLTYALACDLTSVFTFRHNGWTDEWVFRDQGASARHHSLTHTEGGTQPVVDKSIRYIMGNFAALIKRLAETSEGAGSLLDNCAIMGYSEIAQGSNHSRLDIPLITAGRAGGALRTGLYHNGSRESATKLHLTMARAVGLNWESFGEAENKVDSTISQIEA